MIVKNEEENLPRCLDSIKGVVDEIVIVDTGSTDKTVEIAKKYTDKIYHHPWQNDFSLHRNQSISYATGDWLLFIDADEELVIHHDSSIEEFRKTLETIPDDCNAVALRLLDIQKGKLIMQQNTARIFRNGKIHYESIVHNEPKYDGIALLVIDAFLYHYGYDLSPGRMKQKFKRTSKLLLKKLEQEPNNRDVLFYLSQLYAQFGNEKLCQKYGEEYLKYVDELGDDFNCSIYYTLASSYQTTQNFDRAIEIIRKGIEHNKSNIDLFFSLVAQGKSVDDSYLIIEGAIKYISSFRTHLEDPSISKGMFLFSFNEYHYRYVLYMLALTHLAEGINAWNFFKENYLDEIKENNIGFYNEIKMNLKNIGLNDFILDIE
jgi:glycosyltransferase involved in cell wall biosynthesis